MKRAIVSKSCKISGADGVSEEEEEEGSKRRRRIGVTLHPFEFGPVECHSISISNLKLNGLQSQT